MRKFSFLLAVVALSFFAGGCAKSGQKFGRGMSNTFEIVRGGEFRRSMEQTALMDGPDAAHTTGFVHGINRTAGRTGLGLWEMVTAPFPPYEPALSKHFSANPAYPDNYQPGIMEDSMFANDTNLGFSGGDVAPFIPGSRFHVFGNP